MDSIGLLSAEAKMEQITRPLSHLPHVVSFKQHLTIRHMRLISTLARELNISRCADALHTSQSAVSRALSEIEDLLGARLFHRSTRSVTVTPFGQVLTSHADQILSQLDQAEADFSALAMGRGGEIDIGVMGGFCPELLRRATELACKRAPGLTVRLHCDVAEASLLELANGRFNLALTHFDTRRIVQDDFAIDILYQERIGVLCSPRHPLAGRKHVVWRDLAQQGWAITPPETAPRRILEREILIHTGSQMQVVIETKEAHYLVAQLASSGMLGALPLRLAAWYAGHGAARLVPMPDDDAQFAVCIVRRRSKSLSGIETLFVSCLKEVNENSTAGLAVASAQTAAC